MRPWSVRWAIAEELRSVLHPAIVYVDAIFYPTETSVWASAFAELVRQWAQAHPPESLSSDPIFQAVRDMFKAVGIDPTKYRPSSEALIRRVHREGGIPFIHPMVALNNAVSLYDGIPMGCYDPDEVGPHVIFRLGRPGEAFESLRHQEFHAEGRIVIADNGPFGSPIVDSLRTMLKPGSSRCFYVWYAPAQVPRDHVAASVRRLVEWCRTYALGRPARAWAYDPESQTFQNWDLGT